MNEAGQDNRERPDQQDDIASTAAVEAQPSSPWPPETEPAPAGESGGNGSAPAGEAPEYDRGAGWISAPVEEEEPGLLPGEPVPWFEGPATEAEPSLTASPQRRTRSVVREFLETIVLALLIFVAVQGVIQNFKVEGSSMDPNLRNGERLLVNKAIFFRLDLNALHKVLPFIDPGSDPQRFLFREPERGDIIVFRFPRDPGRDFIKRVVGLPGDTVEVRRGRVIVNGKRLREPYIQFKASYNMQPEKVPPGHYWVLGDNRPNSSDSHYWGPVPEENIIGLAWLTYWPPELFGLAPNQNVEAPDGD